MVILHHIFTKFALIGENLTLKQNVRIDINDQCKITNIEYSTSQDDDKIEFSFTHHLLQPKFVNSHTHLGDAVLKDQTFGMSLNEAVGIGCHKYQTKKLFRTQRIACFKAAELCLGKIPS